MEEGRLFEVRGRAGEVMAILRRLPCHLCPEDGHPRAPSSNDFRAKLLAEVFDGAFPASRARRFGRAACFGCGARIKPPPPVMGEIEGEVRVDGADIAIVLTSYVIQCPRCGETQLRPGGAVATPVREAIDAALSRGGLRP